MEKYTANNHSLLDQDCVLWKSMALSSGSFSLFQKILC